MKRWFFPIIYFALCETLDLLYELGLNGQGNGAIGMLSAFALIAITFPAVPVGQWAKDNTATWLGIAPTDTIAYNSFWPRFLSVQFSILVCTLAIVLVALLVTQNVNRNRERSKRRAQ